MPNYACKLVNSSGTLTERSISAKSMGELYQIIDRSGERLISAKKSALNLSLDMDINELFGREVKAKKLEPKDLSMFTRQLEMLLNTGIPMLDALSALEDAAVSPNLKKVVSTLKSRVTQGAQLSAALGEQSKVFSNFYVKMVAAGEASGTLPQILAQIRDFTERDMEARAKVKKALRYPMFVIGALFIAGYVQVAFVLPKMAKTLFSGMGELPLPTRIMLGVSDFASQYGLMFFIAMGALITLIKYYISTPDGAYNFDLLKLNIPKFGAMVRSSVTARFSQMLNVLVSSGVQVVDALSIAGETVDNKVFEKALAKAKKDVLQGTQLSVALQSDYMPGMATSLISIGEKTGALSEMLDGVAQYFTSDMEDKMEGVMGAMEPVLTLVITGFVAIFVLAVFLPMIENMTNMM
jgi:type II secretory pathway component PulF|tara:strand:- start:389 stop:1618 length:1230 start_codon:yes stop_codon:yes gene_type:complete